MESIKKQGDLHRSDVERIHTRMDGLATKQDIANQNSRFNSIDSRFDSVDSRLSTMNNTFIATLVALLVANGGIIAVT